MTFRTRALAIAAVFGLALSACESATNSDTAPEGTLSFTFAGDTAGSYEATGRFDRRRPQAGTFSVGATGQVAEGEALAVFAHAEREGSSTRFDEFLLAMENPEVGTVTCEVGDDEECPFGGIFFIGARATTEETDAIYTSISGTVTITSINEDRARGTFSFQMEGFSPDEDAPMIQVTSGVFDVPLVDAVT